MSVSTILLITLAALFALGFVFFKYFLGNKNRDRRTYVLSALRFLSIFLLLLLLINPKITQEEYEVEKPGLLIAQDLSGSIDYLEKGDSAVSFIKTLKDNPEIQERFQIQEYGFGRNLRRTTADTLNFTEQQTNIAGALRELEKVATGKSAVVLVTDGNQTIGADYQYYRPGRDFQVFPVVAGDTIAQADLVITNLNVNKYAFLNNRFPVELFLNYTGNEEVSTQVEIRSNNAVVFSRQVEFSEDKTSEVITTTLPASSLGLSIYEAEISPLPSEKNVVNNIRKFGVEVIDERTSVLILSAITHPDLGALKKAIESNEQREAQIALIQDVENLQFDDFQLIILFQPNRSFNPVIDLLREQDLNYFLISGTETDWNFLNSTMPFRKDLTYQSQDFVPVYNANYSGFQFEDIGFSRFPPLQDAFGAIEFSEENYNTLLFQQLEGVRTSSPLLATVDKGSVKNAYLFGENIWKWRLQSFVDKGSFEEFDNFFGKLIQYLASQQKRDRLTVDAESLYAENEEIVITAQYFDENYRFNPSGELQVVIENTDTGELVEAGMLLNNNRYNFRITDLPPGDYDYRVTEQQSRISRNGSFTVIDYNVEQQFSSANVSKLRTLADGSGNELYFLNRPQELISQLLEDNRYMAVQKSREKSVPLISWKALLFLLILSLGAEWFTRKYFGLI